MGEALGPAITRELAVVGEERIAELGVAQPLEVHGEERHVRQHIAVSEPVVELEAVEDARSVVEHEDVLGLQVAVAVPGVTGVDALVEEDGTTGEVLAGQPCDPGSLLVADDAVGELVDLGDRPLPQLGVRGVTGRGIDLGRPVGGGVEGGDDVGDLTEVVVDGRFLEPATEASLLG